MPAARHRGRSAARVATDPLVAAEIEIITGDEPLVVTGLPDNPGFELPPNRRIVLPADTPPPPRPDIFVPERPPSPIRAARVAGGRVAALDDGEVRELDPGAPIVLGLANRRRLDLGALSAPAAQAVQHGRRLVVVVGRRG
jgi:hypothetical protein